ncbi:MAG: hypothetical protein Q7U89_01785 [Coriobacteriia bacterium]|nr:hypothetical protein [Coriobacteriia bacterium]
MNRYAARGVMIVGSLLLAAVATACSASTPVAESSQAVSSETPANVLQFGPLYTVEDVPDPVVARTLEGAETTGAPAVSAEIRGYLVDWVIPSETGMAIKELAVMKDGTSYRLPSMMRPAAAFGQQAPARLEPESSAEARVREAAVAVAHEAVKDMAPQFSSATPVVFNYLVRINLADGTVVDVWVDPDVGGNRFFYDIVLERLDD